MIRTWSPSNAEEAGACVAQALADDLPVELVGTGTRRGFGRPVDAAAILDLSALRGVVAYQPEELILAVAPATPMAEIAELLDQRGQCLAFEPPDFGPLWGLAPGQGTVGGAMLTGRGGPRRITAGGPRDHCLGVKGVNGFGEAFGAGGRVVKNVTGFDITKLVTGSFGTLCVVTELTLKVLPAPPDATTLAILDLSDAAAVSAMSRALGCTAQVSSAAHLPAGVCDRFGGRAATLLRVEGVRPSVAARIGHLAELLDGLGEQALLDRDAGAALWRAIGDAAFFAGSERPVWKLSVPPAKGAAVGERLTRQLDGRCFYDWGGGAVWLETSEAPDAHAGLVRSVLREVVGGDGHATLMRAAREIRAAVAPFQPPSPGVAALTERVRRQFDPQGLFNPGRMYA